MTRVLPPPVILAVMGHHRSAAPLNNGANFFYSTSFPKLRSPSCLQCFNNLWNHCKEERLCRHKRPLPFTSPLTCLACPAAAVSGSARVIQPAAMKHGHVWDLPWMAQRDFVGSQKDQDDQNDQKQFKGASWTFNCCAMCARLFKCTFSHASLLRLQVQNSKTSPQTKGSNRYYKPAITNLAWLGSATW